MAIPEKLDFDMEVKCSCGWQGILKDCKATPEDYIRCPQCNNPVLCPTRPYKEFMIIGSWG